MKNANMIAFFLLTFVIGNPVFGQQHTENKADQVLRGSGKVNASTLGMELEIPLGSYPGRGINIPITLNYSSKLWRMEYLSNQPEINNPDDCISMNTPLYAETSASGWTTSLATPYIEYTGYDNSFNGEGQPTGTDEIFCQPVPPPNTPLPLTVRIKRINIHLPGGESHELRDETAPAGGEFPAGFDGIYYAADGSNLKYIQNSANGTYKLLMPDGSFYDFVGQTTGLNRATIRKAVKFSDRNGNFTTYNDSDKTWTDTLGRVLAVPFGLSAPAGPVTRIYSMPGMTGTYRLIWKLLKGTNPAESALTDFNQTLKYPTDKYRFGNQWRTRAEGTFLFRSIGNKFAVDLDELFNPVVLAGIELPTGQSYKFTYDVYGRIERVYYPTGGEERFVYGVIPQLAYTESGDLNAQANFGVVNRKVLQGAGQSASYEWSYNASTVLPNAYKVTIINPDETKTERYLHRTSNETSSAFGYESALAGMAYRVDSFSNQNRLVAQKLTNWTVTQFPNGGFHPKDWHPRVISEESRIYDEMNNGISAAVAYEFEGDLNSRENPLLVKKKAEFAFVAVGSPLPQTLVRTSETTFMINDENYPQWVRNIYKAQNMVGLPTATVVRDGAGTIVSRLETGYDDGDYSPNIGRGNPTALRIWDNTKGGFNDPAAYISTRAKFDAYGNQIESIDGRGVSTMTEYDNIHHTFPVRVVSAVPDPTNAHGSNTAFETFSTFDWITGLPLTSTDANGLETRITYDPVTLRPVNVKTFYQNSPVGGMSETVYHDEPNNYRIKSRTLIDTGKWSESITYFDGLGRAYKAEEISSQGSIYIEKEFDGEGRVKRVTNPFRAGEVKFWTTNVYDEASRIREVILPDGARVQTKFGVLVSDIVGVTKTITDQAGKKRRGVTDALGRMIRVVEDPDGQNLSTEYVFDTLGNLRKTVQGGQNRYFTYNSLGRLLYAKQPEQEANTAFNFTDSITGNSQWSVKYQYDDNGNVTRTTDANGTYIQGTYDNLNRLKIRDYSDATPDNQFYYDGRGLDSVPAFSKGKTTKIMSSVSETQFTSFDALGRLLASRQVTDGKTFNFGYQYNLTTLVAETYPSGRTVSYEFNQDGDLSRVAGQTATGAKTYASAFNYNSSGAIERLRLGNGKWETAQYNERQQVTEIGLGNSATDAGLLKLEYGYGTIEQNNGSLRTQKISFNGLAQSFEQIYSYDDLNRLLSAEEKVGNATTWKQAFVYDRFGNRRFDELQTTTLAISNSLTNPQIDSSTNRFSTGQNYLYDKNGSLTQDAEGRRFLYDAEHHQREVRDANNQIVAVYHYDGDGRRVKKVLPSSQEETIFVYNAGGKLAAEYVINPQTPSEVPATRYLTNDHLGSPRVITDQLGKVINRKDFMAFGEETYTAQRTSNHNYASTPDDAIRQGYTGYEKDDESGLDFAQARYYNSRHGRFTSVDPLTASANLKDPQTFNRFSYALNSPYKYTDPLGLIAKTCCTSAELETQIREDWGTGIKGGELFQLDEESLKKVVKALLPFYTQAAMQGFKAQQQINSASPNSTKITEQITTITKPGKVTQSGVTSKGTGGVDIKIGGGEEAKAGVSTTGDATAEDSKKGYVEGGINGQLETTTNMQVTTAEQTVTIQTKAVEDNSMKKAQDKFKNARAGMLDLSEVASNKLNSLKLTGGFIDTETNTRIRYNKPISYSTNGFDLQPRLKNVFNQGAKKAGP